MIKLPRLLRPKRRDAALARPFFDAEFYRTEYPDVASGGMDPLLHYLDHGWREGRDPSAVFSTLQNKLASVYVNDFNKDGRAYEVLVQSQADFRATPEDIADLHVPGANGAMVPLSAIGTVAYEIGSREVTRFNKMPSASINAQVAPGVAPLELISAIERAGAPEGYHVEWSEMSLQEKENQGRLGLLMGLAALFAYLFLAAQYESWAIPAPVMLSVVVALLGAFVGLWLTNTPLSVYAQLG